MRVTGLRGGLELEAAVDVLCWSSSNVALLKFSRVRFVLHRNSKSSVFRSNFDFFFFFFF